MSTVSEHASTDDDDLAAIRRELAWLRLPLTQDDALAHLVARHVPVRLLCRLAHLPHAHRYSSLDELLSDAARHSP